MSIEFGVWRIDNGLTRLEAASIDYEARLEELLAQDVRVAAPHLMVIGRQVRTSFDKVIDLLAIDRAGNLAVLELKRERTYRDIVAQVLDYGSWVRHLRNDDIAQLFEAYQQRFRPELPSISIDEAFCAHFDVSAMPDELNDSHQLLIVAAELDPSTKRIVEYLAEVYELDINVVFFQFMRDEGREYLCRAWLRQPASGSEEGIDERQHTQWNGEFYVSFGHGETRDWAEAKRYGFISGGGGSWYSNTLSMLAEGDRVWVNVPGQGYVGVGRITGSRLRVTDFEVTNEAGERVPITAVSEVFARAAAACSNAEEAEYLVPVEWLAAVPLERAIREKGFFGNQNTVAKPKAAKWQHTVERLKKRFSVID